MSHEMLRTNKSRAKDRIGRALEQLTTLSQLNSNTEEFMKWRRGTRIAICNTFGRDSDHFEEFQKIAFTSRSGSYVDPTLNQRLAARVYDAGLVQARALLESFLEEIEEYEEYWDDYREPQPDSQIQELAEQQVPYRVFVVHGRDDGTRNTVARFLESLELEVVILQEQASEGRTIIEKFEDHSGVGFAVVLCTPDDVGALATEPDKLNPRPRQNVILELGYFWGKLGRNKVCALLDGDMEMPSDYDGVLYIPMDASEGWKLALAREMKAAGMTIDLNQAV